MKIHILGICGTFMGGIARLAKELGHEVTGSDMNVYPPMSTQLAQMGVQINQGYEAAHLPADVDCVIVGNAISRGNPAIEYVLNAGIPYTSGPAWLRENVLQQRWVLAVSGTHGKTTTSSMVAWILEYAGSTPGFLIGGVPENFGVSARLGKEPYFVIEADEYDTAFFDKRSKFVHYQPKTCLINNIEFDHADIFDDLTAIKKQFHHLVRIVPQQGTVVYASADKNIASVLDMGCWSQRQSFGLHQDGEWGVALGHVSGSTLHVYHQGKQAGTIEWNLIGAHNALNALAAVASAYTVGVPVETACAALSTFMSVKRRLEKIGNVSGVSVYDDFAHHPTAISETLKALRSHVGQHCIMAVLDLRSNSMKMGIHRNSLVQSLHTADYVCVYRSSDIKWPVDEVFATLGEKAHIFDTTEDIIREIVERAAENTHVCVMSNGGFDNIHHRLLTALSKKELAA